MKQSVAILDFGTSKITVLIGSRGINNTISLDGIGMCNYDGYADGDFVAPERVAAAVEQAVNAAESSAQLKVNKLFIGVPADFSICRVNDVNMSLGKKRRVLDSDIDTLFEQGNIYADNANYSVINIQPIYYTLDDELKLIDPVGLTSVRLGGSLSYILARNDFISLVDAAVKNYGIPETEYLSAPLAEELFLFDSHKRDNTVMFADVGALSTVLAIGRGDAICRQYYFAWGGNRITKALSEYLEIPWIVAEELKHNVILSLNPHYEEKREDNRDDDVDNDVPILRTQYIISVNKDNYEFDVDEVNNIVIGEIELFISLVERALKACDYYYPEFAPLYITGGGLAMRGAVQALSTRLRRDVCEIKPRLPLFDNPKLSSALGVMDMVLNCEADFVGFFGKIRRWLSKLRSTAGKE
ncbi:MAG: hypothetical protein J1G04_05375 [Clostridiales bacterium]|nr:hypothetical protein [Clostridiales bacterium]